MLRFASFYMCLGTVLVLSSCMVKPKPVVNIYSSDKNIFWSYGQQFITKKSNNLEVTTAFEREDGYSLIFDIEIYNNSKDTFLVSPEKFYYIGNTIIPQDSIVLTLAYDPEERLLNLKKSRSIERANEINSTKSTFLEGALQLAVDISPKTDEEKVENSEQKQVKRERQEREKEEIQEYIHSLDNSRRKWSTGVLRKTTLAPGYSVYGKVYFNRDINIKSCTVKVPVADELFEFKYIQEIHYP